MPGTLLLDDWRSSVEDQLKQHAQGLGQAFQVIGNPPPIPQGPDPQQVLQELQAHAQQAAEQAQQGITQFAQQRQQQVADVGQQLQDYAQSLSASQPQPQPLGGASGVTQFAQPQQQPPQPPSAAQQDVLGAPPQQTSTSPAATSGLGPIDSSSPAAFARSFAPYAQYAAQKLGVDPTWVAAMAGSESNYGKAQGNELFGVKALPGQPGTTMQTHEGEYGGTTMAQTFASYDTPKDAVDAWVNLIQNHYKSAVGAQDLPTFIHGLKQGGYFTAAEPEYLGIVKGIGDRIGGDVQAGLQGAGQAIGGAASAVGTRAQQAYQDISQFGDSQLSNSEAYAACGPAAAVRFAERFGRNPTLREAVDLAKQVGWSEASGMAGIGSEQSLLAKLGVPTSIVQGAQWDRFGKEAQTGNPVTISTPGHYFYADGYDPSSGAFHVGRSGTDLKGGSEWMTAAQMESLMGGAQGALFADNPTVPATSPESSPAYTVGGQRPVARAPMYAGVMQPAGESDRAPFQVVGDTVGQVVSDLGAAARGALPPAGVSPHPLPGQPGGLVTPPGTYNPPPGSLGGAVGAGAQQTLEDLGGSRAADIALRQGRTQAEQQEFQVRQQEELQRIADEGRRQTAEPVTLGGAATNAWNMVVNSSPGLPSISLQDYQHASAVKNDWIEQNNPARDVPLVGGLTTMVAQQLTDPASLVAMGLTGGAGTLAGEATGARATAATADRLGPEGARVVGQVVNRLTQGSIVGGIQNALYEAEQPGADALSVGRALVTGAALGGVIDAGAVGAAPIIRRLGQQVLDRAPELGPALRARQPAQADVNAALGGIPAAVERLRGGPEADIGTQMQRNFLRDHRIVPNSDPRPQTEDVRLPNMKGVDQAHLGEEVGAGVDTLYHETSVPSARALLDRIESGPRTLGQVFTADNRDLALGQGGKGVMLEFDPTLVNGGANANPVKQAGAAVGAGTEYVVDRSLPGAVKAIIVRNQRQADQLATNARVAARFDFANAQPIEGGGLRIPRKTVATPEPVTPAPVALPLPETAGFRAPERPTPTVAPEASAGPLPGADIPGVTRSTVRVGGGEPPLPPREPPVSSGGTPPRGGGGTPELDRLNAMFGDKRSGPPSTIGQKIQSIGDYITRGLTDRQVDINRMQERYAKNLGRPLRADEMAAELQRLASDPAAQVKVDEGLKPAIQSVGADYPALRNYVTLRSNVEIADNLATRSGKPEVGTDRLFSGGLTRDESAKAMQDLEAQLGPERFARVQAAADQVTQFNKDLRRRLVDAGVLDEGTAAQLEAQYPNWAKTRILDYMADPTGGQGAGTKLGLNDRGLREYTLKGTERAREDPVASTVAYAHQVERMAMKNEAFNAFLKIDQAGDSPMLREVPQSYTPKSNETTMIGFVDGQKMKYVTDNKALGAAINGAGVMSTPEWTSAWQKVFRSLATSRNPLFLAGNAALDIPTYVLRQSVREGGPQALPRIMWELARGYGDAFQGLLQGEYRGAGTSEFLKGGGGQSGYFTGGEGQTKRAVAEMQRKNVFQINGADDMWRLTKDLLTLHPVEALGERIELGPRVAAMRLAERRGANPTKAIVDGRTVTVDFSQGGTATKYLNNFIPFFNVGFQGPAQIARAFRDNPRAFVATVGTLIGIPSAAAEVWNKSDPQRAKDYADVPQYVKDQGVVVMLPGDAPVDAQGNRKPMYAVVKLREWMPFASLARDAVDRVLGDDSRNWQEMASSAGSGLSPIQAQSAAQVGTEPLGGIPILPAAAQLEMNTDFFRGRTIVTQRADQNASALAKTLTPAIQQVVDRAGISAEVRPSAIDFLIRNQGAGVGGAALSASDLAAGEPSDTAGATGTPVVGGFVGRFAGNQTGNELQRARDRTLTTEGRQILRSNGITLTPGAVSGSVNQIPLRIEEETRYQQLANQYIDEAIQRTAASSDFATKTQVGKQSMMDQAMQAARQKAGIQVLNTIPAAEKSRRLKTKSTAAA